MYRSSTVPSQDLSDSKYTVADILSSMASGGADPSCPVSSSTLSAANFVPGISTIATPTLTPTTLSNIEQTLMELQSSSHNSQDRHMQSGFVPPSVHPNTIGVKREAKSTDPDWNQGGCNAKKFKGRDLLREEDIYTPGYLSTSRRPPKRAKDDEIECLPVEEKERRLQRRERNKLAAAKCRQRRVDHTNGLVDETEDLENDKSVLENEIHSLQQQKDQLEFLLQAHKPLCKMAASSVVKHEISEKNVCGNLNLRPMSLPLHKPGDNDQELGVPITTPSNGIFSFNLDNLEGHSGLTPLLSTSCASQLNARSTIENTSAPDPLGSPTLISL